MYYQSRPPAQVAKLLLMDTSGSMANGKLNQLKQVLIDLVASGQYYAQDLISLWSFSTEPRKLLGWAPVRALGQEWSNAVLGMAAGGCTNISSALYRAIGAMGEVRGYRKTIVLLSDGKPEPEPRELVLERIHSAQRYRIRINTIGFGQADQIDLPLLQQLAQATGGSFMHARVLQELTAALRAE